MEEPYPLKSMIQNLQSIINGHFLIVEDILSCKPSVMLSTQHQIQTNFEEFEQYACKNFHGMLFSNKPNFHFALDFEFPLYHARFQKFYFS